MILCVLIECLQKIKEQMDKCHRWCSTMRNENLLKETKMPICNSMHIYMLLYKWDLDISGEIEKVKTVGTGYLKMHGRYRRDRIKRRLP